MEDFEQKPVSPQPESELPVETDISTEALIESAKAELEEPGAVLPEGELSGDTVKFEPDFGNTFDDYGDYSEPTADLAATRIKRRRHVKKLHIPTILIVVIYLAAAVALGLVAAHYGWIFADDVLALTRPDEEVEIVINDSDDLDKIASTLKQAGSIEYEWLFKLYCKVTGSEHYFDPGVYTINKTFDYHAIVNGLMAASGTRETVTLMMIEGSSCTNIFNLLEENDVCTREKLEQAAAEYPFEYEFVKNLPYGSSNRLEGYLFPDTYQFYLKDDPENVLGRLLRNFSAKLSEDDLEAIENSGYSLHEIITMASIVQAEAGNDNERPKIASVIYNRLNNWEEPLLGMDSTVYYGARLLGTGFTTDLDSPYNTYRYPGLPPTPICNPGMNSIRAVLYPEDTDYYYFATGIDGLNHFFETEAAFTEFLNSEDYQDIIPEEYRTSEP